MLFIRMCLVCVCVCVFVAATYYDVDAPFHKALEHLDDILLGSGFLEVRSTCAVRFLTEKLRSHVLWLLMESRKYADVNFEKTFFLFVCFWQLPWFPLFWSPGCGWSSWFPSTACSEAWWRLAENAPRGSAPCCPPPPFCCTGPPWVWASREPVPAPPPGTFCNNRLRTKKQAEWPRKHNRRPTYADYSGIATGSW